MKFRSNTVCTVFLFLISASVSLFAAENGNTANSGKQPSVACLGRIVPAERVLYLSSPDQSSRVIKELRVKRGDLVKKDQVLAVMYSNLPAAASLLKAGTAVELAEAKLNVMRAGELFAALINQEADVQRNEAALKAAKANLEFEIKDDSSKKEIHYAKTRFEELAAVLQASKELLEKMKLARQLDITVSEKELALARNERNAAEANIALTMINAPINGKIIEVFTYEGESVGDNGALAIADVSNMMVEAQVYITDIRKIKTGCNAVITGDGFTGEVTGTVMEITDMVDFNSVFSPDPASFADRRIVKVKIKLEKNDFAAGMINSQVTVKIYGE